MIYILLLSDDAWTTIGTDYMEFSMGLLPMALLRQAAPISQWTQLLYAMLPCEGRSQDLEYTSHRPIELSCQSS